MENIFSLWQLEAALHFDDIQSCGLLVLLLLLGIQNENTKWKEARRETKWDNVFSVDGGWLWQAKRSAREIGKRIQESSPFHVECRLWRLQIGAQTAHTESEVRKSANIWQFVKEIWFPRKAALITRWLHKLHFLVCENPPWIEDSRRLLYYFEKSISLLAHISHHYIIESGNFDADIIRTNQQESSRKKKKLCKAFGMGRRRRGRSSARNLSAVFELYILKHENHYSRVIYVR